VSQHNPADRLLSFGAGDCSPMCNSNILNPAQVDGVVHVILFIDIVWQNRNGHFESGGGHRKLATRSSKVQNAARTEAGIFLLALAVAAGEVYSRMKSYTKVLFSVLAAVICATAFAADQPACKKSGKNCPMNNGKACNCGKSCDC